jgi:Na+-translocating ferredoxin:NAD+ oxidoreductase RnfA subunit
LITGSHIVGASLIGLLVDRLVLDRRLGTTPFSRTSTKLSMALGSGIPVLMVLTISAAITGLLADFVLRPFGAAFLLPVVFTAVIVATTLAGEFLPTKGISPEIRNRIAGRTMIITAILGFLVLVPQGFPGGNETISFVKSAGDAAASGAVFLIVVLVWNGIGEKINLAAETDRTLSPAQQLIMASLIALVLSGISSLRFFHH